MKEYRFEASIGVLATSEEDALNKITAHLSKVARTGSSEDTESAPLSKFGEGFHKDSRAALTGGK